MTHREGEETTARGRVDGQGVTGVAVRSLGRGGRLRNDGA